MSAGASNNSTACKKHDERTHDQQPHLIPHSELILGGNLSRWGIGGRISTLMVVGCVYLISTDYMPISNSQLVDHKHFNTQSPAYITSLGRAGQPRR
jgi:hypothetical protein